MVTGDALTIDEVANDDTKNEHSEDENENEDWKKAQ